VLSAGGGDSSQASVALEELCRTYWYPLYVYVRHKTHNREDAEDLTQAFFARFLEKNYLEGLTSEKGRFRAFLLAALKHFLANEWDRASRQKRGGGVANLSLDWQNAETRFGAEPVDNLSPDKLYDRAWAMTLLERVIIRLRDENGAEGKAKSFEQLKPFLMIGKGAIPYAQAASGLDMTESAVRVAVHRLRERYRERLKAEVAHTVSSPTDVDNELRHLFRVLARTP